MFESLTSKLTGAIAKLRGKGKIRREDLDETARQIKLSLLEADVNFRVVQGFVQSVTQRLVGVEELPNLTIAQHFTGLLHEELEKLLGEAPKLEFKRVLLVGLQGSGKTTSAAKLGRWIVNKVGERPLLIPADVRRPAAIEQLQVMGKRFDLPVYETPANLEPQEVCRRAIASVPDASVIVDSAGRLQIDEALMQELEAVRAVTKPTCTLLVVDAMTGQEALNVAKEFHARCPLDGVILTKIDGDARGGAALSIRAATGIPIAFLGTGENADDLELFSAGRLTNRLLGMGDLTGLIEKFQGARDEAISQAEAKSSFDKESAVDIEDIGNFGRNFRDFTLEDFLKAMQWMKRLGPLEGLLKLMPGFSKVSKGLDLSEADGSMRRSKAMIQSMTLEERRNPQILNGSRRQRIAKGSGSKVEDLNRFLKQYDAMKKMMKKLGPGGLRNFKGF